VIVEEEIDSTRKPIEIYLKEITSNGVVNLTFSETLLP